MPEPENTEPMTNPTPADAADAQPSDGEAPDLAAQLASAQTEAAANYDKFLRTAADLENFRRRAMREKDDLRTTVTGRVLEDIFPVLDTLAFAINAAKQPKADVKTIVEGIDRVMAQLKTALANHGPKEINPLGQPFDPHQHEAISHQASNDVKRGDVPLPSKFPKPPGTPAPRWILIRILRW